MEELKKEVIKKLKAIVKDGVITEENTNYLYGLMELLKILK